MKRSKISKLLFSTTILTGAITGCITSCNDKSICKMLEQNENINSINFKVKPLDLNKINNFNNFNSFSQSPISLKTNTSPTRINEELNGNVEFKNEFQHSFSIA